LSISEEPIESSFDVSAGISIGSEANSAPLMSVPGV
jgi:hypothetical protein